MAQQGTWALEAVVFLLGSTRKAKKEIKEAKRENELEQERMNPKQKPKVCGNGAELGWGARSEKNQSKMETLGPDPKPRP